MASINGVQIKSLKSFIEHEGMTAYQGNVYIDGKKAGFWSEDYMCGADHFHFRTDELDATHTPVFHQCEAPAVDKHLTMSDLKGTLNTVVEKLYGEGTKTRFRPHHFPFTEPSCEMDVQCHECGGVGCRVCKGEGWIELLGAGMVHPKVLAGCGIDPEVYSGWAFGMGLERMAMRSFKISDMRLIFENDTRFLAQF